MIYIRHFFKYFHNNDLNSLIKTWKKVLIPGGILKIQFSFKNNEKTFKKLKNTLTKNNFFINEVNNSDLKIDGSILIKASKEKVGIPVKVTVNYKKFNDIFTILKQYDTIFENKEKLLVITYNSEIIKEFFEKVKFNISHIQFYDRVDELKNLPNSSFDTAIITNFLEFINYSKNQKLIEEIRRTLKPNAPFLLLVPEKKFYNSKQTAQLFDKGIITKILDDNNVKFDWINLSSSFKIIQILLNNNNNFPLIKKDPKFLLLGNYSQRYTFLNNARWDSQARAFAKLGYNFHVIDIRDYSFQYIIKKINYYKPDIIWIGGKDGIKFLMSYAEYFRDSQIKVILWLWDIITPLKFNFNAVIDYMFITSKGEIPLYKNTYNIEDIYYMPIAIMPEIIHRNIFIEEKYDVGFSGQLSNTHPYYKERKEMLDFTARYYDVKIFKYLYNNLPEYYSKCKLIFGGTPYFKNLELYASNRPYIAMGGGCCFITNYFKGLEKLAENEKHLLWYNSKEELKFLLDKYLSNSALREKIKRNAQDLVIEKHNCVTRINNMLDIINGKTNKFYGFINP